MGGVLSHGSDSVDPVYNADSKIITAPLHHRCCCWKLETGLQTQEEAEDKCDDQKITDCVFLHHVFSMCVKKTATVH